MAIRNGKTQLRTVAINEEEKSFVLCHAERIEILRMQHGKKRRNESVEMERKSLKLI